MRARLTGTAVALGLAFLSLAAPALAESPTSRELRPSSCTGAVFEGAQSGAFQFTVRNADGSAVSLLRATNVDVYVSSNVTAAAANWMRLTNAPVITNGAAIFGEPANAAAKFYRVQER